MTKLSNEIELEKESRRVFELFMHPWECLSPESDIGIDYIVQPYDKRGEDTTLHERRFLVQLKATKKKLTRRVKMQLDTKHLDCWSLQSDPVMLALYFKQKNAFYYLWSDQIEILRDQQTQQIYFKDILDQNNKEQVKEYILRYLTPPVITRRDYYPYVSSDLGANNFEMPKVIKTVQIRAKRMLNNDKEDIVEFEVARFRNVNQIAENNFIQKTANEMFLYKDKHKTLVQLEANPDDVKTRAQFAIFLLCTKDFLEAKKQLTILFDKYQIFEAKVLSSILVADRMDLFVNLREFRFMKYLKWKQETPPGTSITMIVEFDGNREFILPEYDERGVAISDQPFKMFRIKVRLNSDGRATPTLHTNGIKLMMGLLGNDGNILYEFGQTMMPL